MRELEYSDETQAQILDSVEKLGTRCKKQPSFKVLPGSVREEFDSIVSAFSEMMYNYHLESPETWTAASLQEILTEFFPRKLLVPPAFFEAVEPALTVFFDYLQETGVLKNHKALTSRLHKSAPVMLRRSEETNGFSPIKQMLLKGFEQGIDPSDTDALNDFLQNIDASEFFPAEPARSQKIGRNEPCPCGSGKKHKKCCGAGMPAESLVAANSVTDAEAEKKKDKHIGEPTLEQWTQLYEVANNLKKLAPWEHLWDSDLITILLPEREEPVYCSVMGRNGECFGIGVYPGYESILGYHRMAQAQVDDPPYVSLFQQDCLMCHFGDREDVMPRDREVMKALGLRFRGRNQWIYFRSMRPGYYPWFIDAKQADVLIQTLQNLAMAYLYLRKGELEVDFDGGETLLRFYSQEKELWLNTATKELPIPVVTPMLVVTDELLITRLKKQKKSGMRLEFDLLYLPTPIQEHKDDIPYLPRMAMLADQKSGLPLDQHMAKPGECIEEVVLDMLCDHIMKIGRPASISVRGKDVRRLLEDTCEKIGVTLIDDKGVPVMNELLDHMLGFMR